VLNVEGRHPAVQEFGDMFTVGAHLPPGLPRQVSELYANAAQGLIDLLPDGVPLTRALSDLWDSKNHGVFLAVRAQRDADQSA
jgi:hypothetical protein